MSFIPGGFWFMQWWLTFFLPIMTAMAHRGGR